MMACFRLDQAGDEYGPHYGEMDVWYEKYGNSAPDAWHDASGIFCVDFFDYDNDGSVEMLVIFGEKNDEPEEDDWLQNYYTDLYIACAEYYDTEEGRVLRKTELLLEGLTFDGFSGVPASLQIVRQNTGEKVSLVYSFSATDYAYWSGVAPVQNLYSFTFDGEGMHAAYRLYFGGTLTEYQYSDGGSSERVLSGEWHTATAESLKRNEIAAEWIEGDFLVVKTVYNSARTSMLFEVVDGTYCENAFLDHTGFHEQYGTP